MTIQGIRFYVNEEELYQVMQAQNESGEWVDVGERDAWTPPTPYTVGDYDSDIVELEGEIEYLQSQIEELKVKRQKLEMGSN